MSCTARPKITAEELDFEVITTAINAYKANFGNIPMANDQSLSGGEWNPGIRGGFDEPGRYAARAE